MSDISSSLQENLLTLLTFDKKACPLIINNTSVELFDSSYYREIYTQAVNYYIEFKAPVGEHLPDCLEHILHGKDKRKSETYEDIIRNIYECFRMLGDSLLVSQGRLSEEHVEQIKALESLKIQTERPIKLVDNLRRMRHNINYYGYTPKKIESDDAILFAKLCFEPLLKAVKEEIEKSESFKRMKP